MNYTLGHVSAVRSEASMAFKTDACYAFYNKHKYVVTLNLRLVTRILLRTYGTGAGVEHGLPRAGQGMRRSL